MAGWVAHDAPQGDAREDDVRDGDGPEADNDGGQEPSFGPRESVPGFHSCRMGKDTQNHFKINHGVHLYPWDFVGLLLMVSSEESQG